MIKKLFIFSMIVAFLNIKSTYEYLNENTLTQEFFDKVPSEVTESKTLKYLKTFESFQVFESNEDNFIVTNETVHEG